MKFLSSRGSRRKYTFQEAAIHGIGDDGGLLLPETLPEIDKTKQKRWSKLNFQDLCTELLTLFLDSEDEKSMEEDQALRDVLPSLVQRSFSSFSLPEVVKIRQLVPATSKRVNGRKNEENHGKEAERCCQRTALTTTEAARARLMKADTSKEQAFSALEMKEQHQLTRAASEVEAVERNKEQTPVRANQQQTREAEGVAQETARPWCNQRDKIFLLELFHGPTFAFKDIALQFLGELLSYSQHREKKTYVVLGATSGDTGSAAIAALKNRSRGLHTVILFPKDRVSPIQKLQMVTANDPRVHCLQVDGTFDDCQEMLKEVLNEYQSRKRLRSVERKVDKAQDSTPHKAGLAGRLCVVNSINCTRILMQTAYWWYAALQLEKILQVSSTAETYASCSFNLTYTVDAASRCVVHTHVPAFGRRFAQIPPTRVNL